MVELARTSKVRQGTQLLTLARELARAFSSRHDLPLPCFGLPVTGNDVLTRCLTDALDGRHYKLNFGPKTL